MMTMTSPNDGERRMNRRRVLLVVGGALASTAALSSACAPAAPPAAPVAQSTSAAGPKPTGAQQATPAVSKPVKKVTFAFATKTINPLAMNLAIGQELGYYRQEGLEVEFKAITAHTAILEGMKSGSVQFGVGSPTFLLPIVAKGEPFPPIQFYEYTYPFKWDWAVPVDSQINEVSQLKGKKLGVASFGTVEQQIGKAMLQQRGINPDTDVAWTAVGEGTTGNIALNRGDIDAMIYSDTGFGAWDVAGMKYRLLPRPTDVPQVGGFFIQTMPETLKNDRASAVGMGRGTAKGSVFALESPDAGASVLLKMFPEVGTPSKSASENIRDIKMTVAKRMQIWKSPDPTVAKWGFIREQEWLDEVKFAGLSGKVADVKPLFTNDLSDEINAFDAEAIKQQARSYG